MDIVFKDSQIQDIRASTLSSIVQLVGLNSVRIDGLASSNLYSNCPLLAIINTTCSPENGCVNIHNMTLSDGIAGAMYVSNSALAVNNSVFANMQHSDSALDIQNTDGSTISISNCTFSNLTAVGKNIKGAALYLEPPSQTAITDCTFSSCTATDGNAGAIYLLSVALLDGRWPNYSKVNITGCLLEDNSAAGSGGAISFYGSGGFSSDYFHMRSSTIRRNNASYSGAVHLHGLYYVGIESCLFEQNWCWSGKGCALSSFGSLNGLGNVLLLDSEFLGNVLPSDALLYDQTAADLSGYEQCAGAYFELGHCMGVSGCAFADNQGAGLCVIKYSGICEAEYSAGDVAYQAIESSSVYQQLFNRSAVTDSTGSEQLTGFLGATSTSMDVRNSFFSYNDATLTQWSRELQGSTTGLWWVGSITGGGGMYIEGIQGAMFVDVTFANNTANAGGGLYLNSCSGIVMWNCTLDGNSALAKGGAIYLSDNQGTGLMLGASMISNNHAGHGGGIACTSPSSFIITNGSVLERNSAWDGGGIYCDTCKEVTVQLNSRLEGNAGSIASGAGSLNDCALVQIGHSQVIGNR